MSGRSAFFGARQRFHTALLNSLLRVDHNGVPTIADKHSKPSREIATGIIGRIGNQATGSRHAGQISGRKFEEICKAYIEETFLKLQHLRPGKWEVVKGAPGGRLGIASFDQYEHLKSLDEAARNNADLAAALGSDYLIKPDVVIYRHPEDDASINAVECLVDGNEALLTSLRAETGGHKLPILHASISCKWTIRSDRAQNARSEGLNLVRNRKGRLPHITVVTAEPMPSRIASIALGTGDIDCVYHFALPELIETVGDLGYDDAAEMLRVMVEGKRLRDISDLPLDLAV